MLIRHNGYNTDVALVRQDLQRSVASTKWWRPHLKSGRKTIRGSTKHCPGFAANLSTRWHLSTVPYVGKYHSSHLRSYWGSGSIYGRTNQKVSNVFGHATSEVHKVAVASLWLLLGALWAWPNLPHGPLWAAISPVVFGKGMLFLAITKQISNFCTICNCVLWSKVGMLYPIAKVSTADPFSLALLPEVSVRLP